MEIKLEISDDCSHEEWVEKTKTIKTWLNNGAVPTDTLRRELKAWAEYV